MKFVGRTVPTLVLLLLTRAPAISSAKSSPFATKPFSIKAPIKA